MSRWTLPGLIFAVEGAGRRLGSRRGLPGSRGVADAISLVAPVLIACLLQSILTGARSATGLLVLGSHVALAAAWGTRRAGPRVGALAAGIAAAAAFRADLLGPATRGTAASLLVLAAWATASTPPWSRATFAGGLLGVAALFHGASWWILPGLAITPWLRHAPSSTARRVTWAGAACLACLLVAACGQQIPGLSVRWMWEGVPVPRWSPDTPYWTEYLLGQGRLGPIVLSALVLGLAARSRRARVSAETHLIAAAAAAFALHEALGGTMAPHPGPLVVFVVPVAVVTARSLGRLGLARGRATGIALSALVALAAVGLARSEGDVLDAAMLSSRVCIKVAEALPFALALGLGALDMRHRGARRGFAWVACACLAAASLAGMEARP